MGIDIYRPLYIKHIDKEAFVFAVSSSNWVSDSNTGDSGSICSLGRSPGEGNGNPPQYSCLENSMDRGAWQGNCKESAMTEWC